RGVRGGGVPRRVPRAAGAPVEPRRRGPRRPHRRRTARPGARTAAARGVPGDQPRPRGRGDRAHARRRAERARRDGHPPGPRPAGRGDDPTRREERAARRDRGAPTALSAALPIAPHLPAIVAAVRAHGVLLLAAPPGTGKTTLVPGALCDAGIDGEVVVLEPRRLAARQAARRVAFLRGSALGGEVGYQVRHEQRVSAATRIRFVTEGILVRRLVDDPTLPGVGCVVLDEFHERHVEGDLALAMLKEVRATVRPDLRLVVMS